MIDYYQYHQILPWDELVKTLAYFDYAETKAGKTGGSRRKFSDKNKNVIAVHKPHPGTIVKKYVIREVITHLREKGKLE